MSVEKEMRGVFDPALTSVFFHYVLRRDKYRHSFSVLFFRFIKKHVICDISAFYVDLLFWSHLKNIIKIFINLRFRTFIKHILIKIHKVLHISVSFFFFKPFRTLNGLS